MTARSSLKKALMLIELLLLMTPYSIQPHNITIITCWWFNIIAKRATFDTPKKMKFNFWIFWLISLCFFVLKRNRNKLKLESPWSCEIKLTILIFSMWYKCARNVQRWLCKKACQKQLYKNMFSLNKNKRSGESTFA